MSKSSIATPTTAAALVATGGGAGESLAGGMDGLGVRRHKASSVSQFGSSLTFGDNIPLPTTIGAVAAPGLAVVTKDGQDVNWTGSCIMTLTKIPLPDVFEEPPREEEESAALWEKLKQESGLLLTDTPADGIFRVPRSKSQCGWWLCWRTHYYYSSDDEEDEVKEELTKEKVPLKKLPEDDRRQHRHMKVPQLPHLPEKAELVLRRTCEFMPKSIWDVITTMLDFSLLKSKSLFLLCLASLIAVIGMYVPLFFLQSASPQTEVLGRYVDDTFVVIDRDQLQTFKEHLNAVFPDIRFTREEDENNELAFLDVLVGRKDCGGLKTNVFRKATNTMQVQNFNSNHPISHKRTSVRTLYRRVKTHCSETEDNMAELQYLRRVFKANGYPRKYVNRCIRKMDERPSRTDAKFWRALLHVKKVSEAVGRLLAPLGVGVAHRPEATIRRNRKTRCHG
nr:unnamed protein product [Spirometra erinaceieuropaei]